MEELIGDKDQAEIIKEYTPEEVTKIIEEYDSITNREYYILHLLTLLIKTPNNKSEVITDEEEVKIETDYERFIKEIYDFPHNDIKELENIIFI